MNERVHAYVCRAFIRICCAFMRMRMYEYVRSCICAHVVHSCLYVSRACVHDVCMSCVNTWKNCIKVYMTENTWSILKLTGQVDNL